MNESELHAFRKQIDICIVATENDLVLELKDKFSKYIREMSLARTKLQEAKMWVGKCLEKLGSELPKEYQDKSRRGKNEQNLRKYDGSYQ